MYQFIMEITGWRTWRPALCAKWKIYLSTRRHVSKPAFTRHRYSAITAQQPACQ